MAGKPGTPRFGSYGNDHESKPNANGQNKVDSQADGSYFTEQHYLYNPAQQSRNVGQAPAKYYDEQKQQYDAPCNHDGFEGGDIHLVNMDERKVLDLTIFSQKIECADDEGYNAPFGGTEASA